MKRTFAITTVALSLGLTACKGGAGDAMQYVPEGASVIGGADLAALQKSPVWEENKDKIESGEGGEMMKAAEECNLGKANWKNVVFGADASGLPGKMVVVLNVNGIGKKENLDCMAGKAKEAGEEDFVVEEKDGKTVLTLDGGKMTGYTAGDNLLVVAGKDWTGAVQEIIDGKGKSAIDGSLKDVVGRANTKEHFWIAGSLPAAMLEKTPAQGLKDGTVSMNFSDGLSLAGNLGFESAEDATAKAASFNEMFEGYKGIASKIVPEGVINSVKIEAKDSAVHVEAKASTEDIKEMSKKLPSP